MMHPFEAQREGPAFLVRDGYGRPLASIGLPLLNSIRKVQNLEPIAESDVVVQQSSSEGAEGDSEEPQTIPVWQGTGPPRFVPIGAFSEFDLVRKENDLLWDSILSLLNLLTQRRST